MAIGPVEGFDNGGPIQVDVLDTVHRLNTQKL